jgi:hypothetical protein
LHIFLADDTIEVVEIMKPNSGRDPFPTFMKRQKPPEGFSDLADIKIGATVNIYGRGFVMYV